MASGKGGTPFGRQYAPLPFEMHIGNGDRSNQGCSRTKSRTSPVGVSAPRIRGSEWIHW